MDKDSIYIEEIKEFCQKIIGYTAHMGFEQFVDDEKTQLAVIKLIENVGEASKRISDETRAKYLNVDWKKAMAMRDKLVHHYMDVDIAIVFDVSIGEIPSLLKNLES
jgi:uncharacterized protein with HEPN domain